MKFMFLTVDVGEEREIKRELFELSGLAEKPGQNSPSYLPAALIKFSH
ncbi:MAG: hypothetical protein HN524_13500 [Verrucomicrobia bacterium]|jgi:hypothetical protein|nr:hypothetical protein [Verrucomicrobiota bacterium]MBT3842515.1 hypothetical protein [Verrucomicrobiota bacterium]